MQNIVEFYFFNLSSLKLGIEICHEAIHPKMIRTKVKMRIVMEQLEINGLRVGSPGSSL